MVSTFSQNKNIEEPANGDYPGTWDVPVNADWTLIDTAFGGTLNLNSTGLSGTHALTNVQLQPPSVQISGAPTAAITYTAPTGVGGVWIVRNTTTGGKTVGFASAAGGSTVTIPASQQIAVWCDGTATGMLIVNSVYDSSGVHFPDASVQATAFVAPVTSDPSGSAHVDFTGVAATVNTLEFDFSLTLSAADTLGVQFYNSIGVLDTSGVYADIITVNINGSLSGSAASGSGLMPMSGMGSTEPVSGRLWISGIQEATRTGANWILSGVDSTNSFSQSVTGGGVRAANGPITGVRFLCLSGATMTGHISMLQTT